MTLQRRQIAPLILCLVLASAPPPLAAQPAPPQVPVPHAPTGGTRATDEFPTLRWSRLPSAQNYHVQLSAHPYPFSAPHLLEEATTADTAFTLSAVLDANRSYTTGACAPTRPSATTSATIPGPTPCASPPAACSTRLRAPRSRSPTRCAGAPATTPCSRASRSRSPPTAPSTRSSSRPTTTAPRARRWFEGWPPGVATTGARAFEHRAEGKQAGPWSSARRLTTLDVPSAPHLKAPAPGAEGLGVGPRLAWFSAPRAARYVLEIAPTPEDLEHRPLLRFGDDPAAPLDETQYTVPRAEGLLDYGTAYLWRVRATNAAGLGPWSATWRFETGPEGPDLISPADAATGVDLPVRLVWQQPPGAPAAAFFTLEVSSDSTFARAARQTTEQASFEIARAPGRVWHFWRVRTHYADGSYSAWSPARRFRTRPEAPQALAPAHDARMVPLPVSLRWQPPEEPTLYGAAFHFRVDVFQGSDLASPVLSFEPVEAPRLCLDASQLSYSQCYHWRVKVVSRDAEADEPASLWSRLKTVCFDRYPAPRRRSPLDGEVVWTRRPSLLWQALSQADLPLPFGVLPTHYDVQIGRGPDLDDPSRVLFEGSVAVPDPEAPPERMSYLVPGDLAADTDYWWRLRARHLDDGLGP